MAFEVWFNTHMCFFNGTFLELADRFCTPVSVIEFILTFYSSLNFCRKLSNKIRLRSNIRLNYNYFLHYYSPYSCIPAYCLSIKKKKNAVHFIISNKMFKLVLTCVKVRNTTIIWGFVEKVELVCTLVNYTIFV